MKKLLTFLIVVGVGGFLVYRYVFTSAETRSCQKLAQLCGEKSDVEKCVQGINELGKTNSAAVSKFNSCVSDAKSCGEGAGCLVGVGLSTAGNMLNEFLKGVGKALEK